MRSCLAATALFLLLFSGCGPERRHVEPTDLFWPLPPEKPRIHYITSIYSEDDIGYEYSFREILFGKSYVDFMTRPYGIFARDNRIYATDIAAMRVLVYDRNKKRVLPVGREGAVRVPAAAVADAAGTMYIADAAQAKIALYDPDGRYRTAFMLGGGKPVALALNEALGRIYVVDRNQYKVVVLSLSGARLFEFGTRGRENGQFNIPLSIAVDRSGNVYVLDSGNFRVQVFDSEGKFLRKFGSVGDRPGFFANPKGIAVDSGGHIYVTDAAFSNFQIFDPQGNPLLFVGRMGAGAGEFYLPGTISIDENDRIYVADQFNSRISIFQYLAAP
jgi:DNA-binding beta-propeller fold protein YncE